MNLRSAHRSSTSILAPPVKRPRRSPIAGDSVLVPGAANLYVLAMMPRGHEATVFSGHRYALTDEADDNRTAYLNRTPGPEDQSRCESVQQELKSQSYNQGRFMVDPSCSGTAEHGVHRFHRLVTKALG